jgi:cyclopropane-fatty-acyl-phospholipid synthase
MRRISNWLNSDGKLFVHVFCHRELSYLFETEGASNWMGRHFFTGGIMPSDNLLLNFQEILAVEDRWQINGTHYAKTCEAWLRRLDGDRQQLDIIFQLRGGKPKTQVAVQRWRMFFMACEELFKYNDGNEWYVAHYLFQNQSAMKSRSDSSHDSTAANSSV